MQSDFWIRTDRLLLRPWQMEDLGRLILLSHDPGFVSQSGSFCQPMDQISARAWIEFSQVLLGQQRGHWGIVENGHLVGIASLIDQCLDGEDRPMVTIEYRLAHSARGRGLATEALAGVLEFGRSKWGIEEFYALIPPDNLAAKNVAFKLSMTYLRRAFFCGQPTEVFHVRPTQGEPTARFARREESAA